MSRHKAATRVQQASSAWIIHCQRTSRRKSIIYIPVVLVLWMFFLHGKLLSFEYDRHHTQNLSFLWESEQGHRNDYRRRQQRKHRPFNHHDKAAMAQSARRIMDHAHERPDHDDGLLHQQRTVLVVGGSDGSGTRAVVQALGQLGVPMLVDDSQTLDVHIASMGGWPLLVQGTLLANTGTNDSTTTANYVWPGTLANDVVRNVTDAWRKVDRTWSRRLRRMEYAFQKAENPKPVASRVDFGFKAPVSMLVLPFLQHFYQGKIRFLHVVRDGRDVALSSNQSPVEKFYDAFYGNALQRRIAVQNQTNVLAMDLWNDWNVQVAELCNGGSWDCLVVRTEDLLKHKHATLQRMAAFVGSPYSDMNHLCCLAHRDEKDLGVSVEFEGRSKHRRLLHRENRMRESVLRQRTDDTTLEVPAGKRRRRGRPRKPAAKEVEPKKPLGSRFGKWKDALQENPALLRLLEEHGKRGLELFGYEPMQDGLLQRVGDDIQQPQLQKCDNTIIAKCPAR